MDKKKIKKIENTLVIVGGISSALSAVLDNWIERLEELKENLPEEYRERLSDAYGYLYVKKNTPVKRKIWNLLMILERIPKEEREDMNHIF